ncbi:MAG: carbamoyl-phosphate synthase (glutamine-hydrolyzing) large subunit [Porphyromonas sp.]|nr:carbamoyl-phosphate synthase (glutamine-hydrolyzing) large subunit [Porphyromonas sp.]
MRQRGVLILSDGSRFEGEIIGAKRSVSGEVVFSTEMTGYTEVLTDPTFDGQIVVDTFPIVGNYGMPSEERDAENGLMKFWESEKLHPAAYIIHDYTATYSHWNAVESLEETLSRHGVVALIGPDTREIALKLRENGPLTGRVVVEGEDDTLATEDFDRVNRVAEVSTKEVKSYKAPNAEHEVVLVDCGVKQSLIKQLLSRGLNVRLVPWDYDFTSDTLDGVVISNGPGDPRLLTPLIERVRELMKGDTPIFGVGMGHQVIALAAGMEVTKMQLGHRSANQPVQLCGTNRCFITSQNHGFAVKDDQLPEGWHSYFRNLNDGTNEGLIHNSGRVFSIQFHPEVGEGEMDTEFVYNDLARLIKEGRPVARAIEERLLPKRSYRKVLVLGSGALKIGEAGEFDYSGSQALKALREEGVHTVLVNPNIATVQTSEGVADEVYFLPVTPYFLERVIEKERPDGILLAFGGQTALNCGVALERSGVLERYGVEVLGTPVQTIIETEDRDLFAEEMRKIDVETIPSEAVENIEEAKKAALELGYPVIIRAAFALGGLGSGFCDNEEELQEVCEKAFSFSPQVLVEKSLKGWKEIEYEVVRDRYDNCITVCNMENFDPLGIHTGESIVIAPTQTLTNSDHHLLRQIAMRIVRHVGIVGECNVQFAYDPQSEDYKVIEINARLSRSSALASKATGYPLAFIAAKLGLGYGIHELKNTVTGVTSAFFEPALDYVVCKIPRWDLSKFHGVSRELGSSMKSVGEIMSIGRTMEEVIQKGLRMIGQGMHGFVQNKELVIPDVPLALNRPTDNRIFVISKAFRQGFSVEEIHDLTKIDRYFLYKLRNIMDTAEELEALTDYKSITPELLAKAKRQGFSDFQIVRALYGEDEPRIEEIQAELREYRKGLGITPVVRQIDTMAGEYPAQTNYLYLSYDGKRHDVPFYDDKKSVVVLGSGAYRIGSSVEFDWCGVSALNTIRKEGYRSIMINYNPETVSTDYDLSDRLYFDELTFERVQDILELEQPKGTILSTGGQIPNNLAVKLDKVGVPILGTQPKDIDNAEDRNKFSAMLDRLGVDQPAWKQLTTLDDVVSFVEEVGYPVLVRPSYVLSGAAMNVCSNFEELERFLKLAANVSQKHPVVVSSFLENAKEIELDAVADHGELVAYAISEHIEYAGVHSGDATIQFPAQRLYIETIRRIKRITRQIAGSLHITGPFNIQFLAKGNEIKVIECNLRASRSFPFVSKVLKLNLIELATKIMLGSPYESPHKSAFDLDYVGVKASQFSFSRLQKADPVLGVDMTSTGEVGCVATNADEAVLQAMLSVGHHVPEKAVLMSTGGLKQKVAMLDASKMLQEQGYKIYATEGTHKFLLENGVENELCYWPSEEGVPQALDLLHQKEVDLVININKNLTPGELTNGYKLRRAAVDLNIPVITNSRLASSYITAFCRHPLDEMSILSWREVTQS